MAPERFAIQVPDSVLTDLQRRLEATRWPDELEQAGWEYGTNLAYMRSLTEDCGSTKKSYPSRGEKSPHAGGLQKEASQHRQDFAAVRKEVARVPDSLP